MRRMKIGTSSVDCSRSLSRPVTMRQFGWSGIKIFPRADFYSGDAESCAVSLQDLLKLRSDHGPVEQVRNIRCVLSQKGRSLNCIVISYSQPPPSCLATILPSTSLTTTHRLIHPVPLTAIPSRIACYLANNTETPPSRITSSRFSSCSLEPIDPVRSAHPTEI
jgi:hypothetical protein